MINATRFLTGPIVVFFLLFGAAATATESQLEHDIRFLWTRAQHGDEAVQYRLGRRFESRYWLAEHEEEIGGNPADLVIANALFRLAKRSNELDPMYGWNETEYRLKRILSDQELRAARAALPEWMKAPSPPPSRTCVVVPTAISDAANARRPAMEASEQRAAIGSVPLAEPDPHRQAQSRGDAPHADLETLLACGIAYLDAGDPVSARIFLRLAAARESGKAAMLLAMTYDPAYLAPRGASGLVTDVEQAAAWYLKAIEMGHSEAEWRLKQLEAALDQRSP